MDFGPKFTLVREGTLLADIAARARTPAPCSSSGARTSRRGLSKPSSRRPSARSQHACEAGKLRGHRLSRSRPRFAPPTLVAWIRRCAAKGSTEAREDLRRLLSGTCRRAAATVPWIGCARRLLTARKAKEAGMRIATGKKQIEKTKGVRGGKMGGAFRVIIRGLSVIVQKQREIQQVHNRGGESETAPSCRPGVHVHQRKARAELAEIALNWILRGKQ